ncbi:MAG TPA: glycosyltransferase family 39 protein, partial [Verrucomicrobiales bacterium]|nr:glycosyltransferase family 39 protein [Verrucomicrobiales bacterium]
MPRPELSFTQRMLIGGMALLTVLRWVLGMTLEISPEEALLAEWGRHASPVGLHGGFGTAWFSWMSTLFAGWTPLGVRFFAPLLAAAASAVLYRLVRSLSGDKAAAWSVALINLTPLWNFAATFLEPQMPGMLMLLCGMAAVWRALRRASAWDWHWPLAGLLFGAGFLCWYGTLWGPVSTM